MEGNMAVNFELLYQKYGALSEEVNRRKKKDKNYL